MVLNLRNVQCERGFNTKYGMEEADAVNFNIKARY